MIKKFFDLCKNIIDIDDRVYEHLKEKEDRTQRVVAVMCAAGFGIMSILNIISDSDEMLVSTIVAAVCAVVGYVLTKLLKSRYPVLIALALLLMFLFPLYTYFGGNDGFACMWIIIVAYLDMYVLGIKYGFLINVYYIVLLFFGFYGLIPGFNEAAYTETFLLRFPVFFLVNSAFATFFVASIRLYQNDLIEKQQQLERLGIMDMNTDIYNRNGYIKWSEEFDKSSKKSLAYIYIDANGLHEINNGQGHEAGDRFLRAIADTCKQCFANKDVYRLGGDEFLVICYDQTLDEVTSGIWQTKAVLKKDGWNIAFGIDYKEGDFDLESMLKTSNKLMLDDKAAFYSTRETDRRHSRM